MPCASAVLHIWNSKAEALIWAGHGSEQLVFSCFSDHIICSFTEKSSSDCPGQVPWFFEPFQELFVSPSPAHLYSQQCTSQHRPTELCLVCPVPPGQLILPCSLPVDKCAKQAAQVGFAAHRLLGRLLQAALGSHSVSEQSTPGSYSRHPKGKAAAAGHSQKGSMAL